MTTANKTIFNEIKDFFEDHGQNLPAICIANQQNVIDEMKIIKEELNHEDWRHNNFAIQRIISAINNGAWEIESFRRNVALLFNDISKAATSAKNPLMKNGCLLIYLIAMYAKESAITYGNYISVLTPQFSKADQASSICATFAIKSYAQNSVHTNIFNAFIDLAYNKSKSASAVGVECMKIALLTWPIEVISTRFDKFEQTIRNIIEVPPIEPRDAAKEAINAYKVADEARAKRFIESLPVKLQKLIESKPVESPSSPRLPVPPRSPVPTSPRQTRSSILLSSPRNSSIQQDSTDEKPPFNSSIYHPSGFSEYERLPTPPPEYHTPVKTPKSPSRTPYVTKPNESCPMSDKKIQKLMLHPLFEGQEKEYIAHVTRLAADLLKEEPEPNEEEEPEESPESNEQIVEEEDKAEDVISDAPTEVLCNEPTQEQKINNLETYMHFVPRDLITLISNKKTEIVKDGLALLHAILPNYKDCFTELVRPLLEALLAVAEFGSSANSRIALEIIDQSKDIIDTDGYFDVLLDQMPSKTLLSLLHEVSNKEGFSINGREKIIALSAYRMHKFHTDKAVDLLKKTSQEVAKEIASNIPVTDYDDYCEFAKLAFPDLEFEKIILIPEYDSVYPYSWRKKVTKLIGEKISVVSLYGQISAALRSKHDTPKLIGLIDSVIDQYGQESFNCVVPALAEVEQNEDVMNLYQKGGLRESIVGLQTVVCGKNPMVGLKIEKKLLSSSNELTTEIADVAIEGVKSAQKSKITAVRRKAAKVAKVIVDKGDEYEQLIDESGVFVFQ